MDHFSSALGLGQGTRSAEPTQRVDAQAVACARRFEQTPGFCLYDKDR